MDTKSILFETLKYTAITPILMLGGCASINFDSNDTTGLVYYEPKPYLFYSQTTSCVSSVTAVTLPGKKKVMSFGWGIGSSDLSANFSNGVITAVGQTNDSKLSETLTSIAAVAGVMTAEGEAECQPVSLLFPIDDKGLLNSEKPINLLIWEKRLEDKTE
ncbi:hypothetical protein [Marinobacter arenosus]|uniref:hypothetical protein n=1 Tax=Marinobacter arenosus TaxID=2856822 RepID=UPI001C4D98F9|nr:hypothetical protein [Marinobacter arenosus]MBW0148802.1 hypothetical protein [Marinobacter arenosus]